MEFNIMTVGDMLEGFMDNMSEEQIDKEIKLFRHITWRLKGPGHDYAALGVLIDEDHIVDEEMLQNLEGYIGYQPYLEKNEISGNNFLYFGNIDDAENAAAYLKSHINE